MAMNGSPIILPSNVTDLLPRDPLLKANEWKCVWRNAEPRRIRIVARWRPKPDWAQHEWEPWYDALNEDTACRAVLRTFVAEGWEPEMVDDAMGEAIALWAANPQRTMSKPMGDKNDLIRCYHAVRSHLVDGGRLRDCPVNVVTIVAENMGLARWRHWLQAEVEQHGAFTGVFKELTEDCWKASGSDDTLRIDESPHLERRSEVT